MNKKLEWNAFSGNKYEIIQSDKYDHQLTIRFNNKIIGFIDFYKLKEYVEKEYIKE